MGVEGNMKQNYENIRIEGRILSNTADEEKIYEVTGEELS